MSMANSSSFTIKLQVHRTFAEKTYQAWQTILSGFFYSTHRYEVWTTP